MPSNMSVAKCVTCSQIVMATRGRGNSLLRMILFHIKHDLASKLLKVTELIVHVVIVAL